uniref:Uncharacterized protein n=1 Tax=Aegilops tauschii subsp. strangulata TaxID=200361 RepID=A0A453NTS4_AEGTS
DLAHTEGLCYWPRSTRSTTRSPASSSSWSLHTEKGVRAVDSHNDARKKMSLGPTYTLVRKEEASW